MSTNLRVSCLLILGLAFVACKKSGQSQVQAEAPAAPRATAIAMNQATQTIEVSVTDDVDSKKLFELLQLGEQTKASYFFKSFDAADELVHVSCERNKLPVGLAHSCSIRVKLSDAPGAKTKIAIAGTQVIATLDEADASRLLAAAEGLDFSSHDGKLTLKCESAKSAVASPCTVAVRLK